VLEILRQWSSSDFAAGHFRVIRRLTTTALAGTAALAVAVPSAATALTPPDAA
jgi:hypothetical protein